MTVLHAFDPWSFSCLHLFFTLSLGLSRLSLQSTWAMESLESFPFDEEDKVLDLGCGSGSVTAGIAAKVPLGIVVGLNISEEMLTYAREHYSASNVIYMPGSCHLSNNSIKQSP